MLNIKIDMDAEKKRLEKEIAKIKIEITKCENKVSNKSFIEKAPEEVVQLEKDRLLSFTKELNKFNSQLESLLS